MSEMTLDVVDEVFSARQLWHCSIFGEAGHDVKKGTAPHEYAERQR